jgi:hypothetical protein
LSRNRRRVSIRPLSLVSPERPEEIALEGGGDCGGDRCGRHCGERLDCDNVAGHHEPDYLRADEVCAEWPILGAEHFGSGVEELAGEELPQHAGDLGFTGGGADDAGQALVELGLLEHLDEERGEAFADRFSVTGEDRRKYFTGG